MPDKRTHHCFSILAVAVRLMDVTRSRIVGTDLRHIVQSGYPRPQLRVMYAHSTPTAAPARSRYSSPRAADDVCSSLRDVQSLILEVGMQEAIARCLATLLDVMEGNECSLVGKEEEGVLNAAMGKSNSMRVGVVLFTYSQECECPDAVRALAGILRGVVGAGGSVCVWTRSSACTK